MGAADEKTLIYCVLERAILDLANRVKESDKKDAVRWFKEWEPKTPFSFAWVCEALDLDAKVILRRMPEFQRLNAQVSGTKVRSFIFE